MSELRPGLQKYLIIQHLKFGNLDVKLPME